MRLAFLLAGVATSAHAASTASPSLPLSDPSYVVQIHSSRDGFVPPPDAAELFRTQLMTTESGHRFKCFVPFSQLQKEERASNKAEAKQIADASGSGGQESNEFLTFARAASKKVRPMCLQYMDPVDKWVYEICPGVLIRKVSLRGRGNKVAGKDGGVAPEATVKPKAEKAHEVDELASYASDSEEVALAYEEFAHEYVLTKIKGYKKPMYTQVFKARGKVGGQEGDIKLQFVCSTSSEEDLVGGVLWRERADKTKEPAAFVVTSRVFCNPKHAGDDGDDEKFTVASLLEPLSEHHTCIKRNEGWWTYEFCFGQGIRQYHRENDGKVTAEFSLGSYDEKKNEELEQTGGTLVMEPLDATHDAARPAFAELYTGGTHCKEFDVSKPRKSRVLFYCNQASANHNILAVKETQTCTYTIKISTPAVCNHPHFITEEEKPEEKAEVVNCIPLASDESSVTSETVPPTEAPTEAPVREVEVSAT